MINPYYNLNGVTIYHGDCLSVLRELPAESVNCCVTSPPYWGLRDYGTAEWEGGDDGCDHAPPDDDGATIKPTAGQRQHAGRFSGPQCWKCGARRIDAQLGLEATPDEYVSKLVEVFREVRRVLKSDGTLWLVIGDSYAGSWGNYGGQNRGNGTQRPIIKGSATINKAYVDEWRPPTSNKVPGLKPKDLVGVPWRVAFALQADGWYLRSDIIWSKPNPMPESVTDRPTKAHEYIFLLAKNERYYFDQEAVKEPMAEASESRYDYAFGGSKNEALVEANRNGIGVRTRVIGDREFTAGRNIRSVWTVPTQNYNGAHFATFPEDLIKPCILAGCPAAGTVLDPFFGSGTTGAVARSLQCHCIGIELNKNYCQLAANRFNQSIFNFIGTTK